MATGPRRKNKKNRQAAKPATVRAPVAIGTIMRTPQYKFGTNGKTITVNHREYLGSIVTTNAAFETCQTFVVNPADYTTFPWLFSVSRNFSAYRMLQMKVMYISEAATTTTGTVMVAYSPDPSVFATPPATKVAMMEYDSALRCAPWENAQLTCKLNGNQKYVKPGTNYGINQGSVVSSLNIVNLTDVRAVADGAILISASNVASGVVGDIFVEYTVELSNPQAALARPVGCAQCATAATSLFSTGSNLIRAASEMAIVFAANSITFTFTGECFVYLGYTGSATATMAAPTVSTGCTLVGTSNIVNTTTPFASCILLTLACTGLTTITQGAATNLAVSTTKVSIMGYLSSQLAVQVFP